ncbi:G -coupled receptor 89 [Pyrrhoderma noxium]|uniref:G-coupled receptor 89 n=1 Tax=Pyrrhoderma noxium TaxID=2282107 RepID=A0A286U8G8_9AGAM|nr:G -coupled receptor 89 [Pyrrhoderma noxium]
MSSVHLTVINSALITSIRAGLFYASYKYLLHTFYHDLQNITSGSGISTSDETARSIRDSVIDEDSDIELDSLPVPNSSSSSLRPFVDDQPFLRKRITASSVFKHSNIARISFSICFSESCTLFFLFMTQEIHILNTKSRYINWRISLLILLIMILLVIPLSQNIILTYQSPLGSLSRSRSMPMRVMMAFIPYSIYLFALSLIPIPPEAVENADVSNIESVFLARLIVFGTFVMGLLSGLGAARNIWEYLSIPFGSKKRHVPTEQEVTSAEEALKRVRNDIQTRRGEELRLQEASAKDSSSWMSRVASSITGSSELASIQQEITGLLALEYQMTRNLEALKSAHSKSKYGRTARGRVIRWMGRIFAVYCVFRSISCLLNILGPFHSSSNPSSSSYTDLIALVLTHLINALPFIHLSTDKILAVSRQVSLILVGAIILSSIGFILRIVSRFLRITSQNLGASLLLLILAQIMGTYLISTLVQLRTAFPPSNSGSDISLLATLPAYEVFGAAFDYSYLLSASLTGVYLWLSGWTDGPIVV